MESIWLLVRSQLKNRVKKALRKPVTYFGLAVVVVYLIFFAFSSEDILEKTPVLQGNQGLGLLLSALVLLNMPTTLWQYSQKKGIVFFPADTVFLFTSPLSPKLNLLYGKNRSLLSVLGMEVLLILYTVYLLQGNMGLAFLYVIVNFLLQIFWDSSLALLLYANENIPEKRLLWIRRSLLLSLGAVAALLVYLGLTQGLHMGLVNQLLNHPALHLIPLVGWKIAFVQLFFGAFSWSVLLGSCLHLVSIVLLVWGAGKVRCTGQYYEEASSFANDYRLALEKSKKGKIGIIRQQKDGDKKERMRTAGVKYRGKYAAALFYRQYLEMKKKSMAFFIITSGVLFALSTGFCFLHILGKLTFPAGILVIIPAGLYWYATSVFSRFSMGWETEGYLPFIYMIPDRPMRKMWYSNLLDLYKSLLRGICMVLPMAVTGIIPLPVAIGAVLIVGSVELNTAMCNMITRGMLRGILGFAGEGALRFFMTSLFAAAVFITGGVTGAMLSATPAAIFSLLVAVIFNGILFFPAARVFCKMEKLEG